jgi:dienelactone hydrolase
MTRRQLAQLTVAQALPGAERKYTGALDGFEDKVAPAAFDPVAYTLQAAAKASLKLTFRARNRAEAEAWQRKLRPKIAELLGGFPVERSALRPQTLEVRQFPGYRREKFVFESRPGFAVLGYLLTPAGRRAPFPAVVCVPGHGRGVDDIVGIDDKGRDRTDKDGYQHDFAIQAVEHGLAAVAIEPIGFGCRRDDRTKKKALSTSACQPVAGTLLLMGQTMIGWRVWDVMRTIDWIETRKDLDAKRVGCMGISGGGTCTTFSAALEPRIRAAMISGYLNTFRDSIMAMSHCIDNYVPNILEWAEQYDVASLIAPRPLFAESGERDNIFPIEASRGAFNRVRKVYEIYGVADKAEQETFDDKHAFCGKRGIPFLAKHLGA